MSRILFVLVVSIALAGCASKRTAKADAAPKESAKKVTAKVVQPEPPPKTRLMPINGRIAKVNEPLRFVVLDFTNSRRPALDERLGVYRVGQKVAEIKVSGPFLNTTVTADIVAGEVKYGDEVKAE